MCDFNQKSMIWNVLKQKWSGKAWNTRKAASLVVTTSLTPERLGIRVTRGDEQRGAQLVKKRQRADLVLIWEVSMWFNTRFFQCFPPLLRWTNANVRDDRLLRCFTIGPDKNLRVTPVRSMVTENNYVWAALFHLLISNPLVLYISDDHLGSANPSRSKVSQLADSESSAIELESGKLIHGLLYPSTAWCTSID